MMGLSAPTTEHPESYFVTERDNDALSVNMQLEGSMRPFLANAVKPILISGSSLRLREVDFLHKKRLLPAGAIALDATLGISPEEIGEAEWTLITGPLFQVLSTGIPRAMPGLSYSRRSSQGIDPRDSTQRRELQAELREMKRIEYQHLSGNRYPHLLQQMTDIQVLSPKQARDEHEKRLALVDEKLGKTLMGYVGQRVPRIDLPNQSIGGVLDYMGPFFSLDSYSEKAEYLRELERITDPQGVILIATSQAAGFPMMDDNGWNVKRGPINRDNTQTFMLQRA